MKIMSWNGTKEKALRGRGLKGFYPRYRDRRSRSGVQLVKPRENWNDIYDQNGHFIRSEPKYHHYNSDEVTANKTFQRDIKKPFERREVRVPKSLRLKG